MRIGRQLRSGDFFGGLSAMLVVLPSAIAFGLIIYAPLGPELVGHGAMTGILGTIGIGIIASAFNGTPRLISAPCAPAAAVLAALVTGLLAPQPGTGSPLIPAAAVPAALLFVALLAGALQVAFGLAGGGKIIKYIPYPVVAGYLSGVGILIILGQLPQFFGLSGKMSLLELIQRYSEYNPIAVSIAMASVIVMILAPRWIKAVPAPILAVSASFGVYFLWALIRPDLLSVEGNALVIGPLSRGSELASGTWTQNWLHTWSELPQALNSSFRTLLASATTLAVLLSIDTLKTCVVVDALTRSRHESNRELLGQGLGNLCSALIGGMPGAGTMGATLVNLNGGGQTRLSGLLTGFFALTTLLVFGKWLAWLPFAALSGILLVIGFRMIDRQSLILLRQRSTIFDFLVIFAVVLTAVFGSLIAAAGVGLALSTLLFVREQVRGTVVRNKLFGNQIFSKKRRLPREIERLEKCGNRTIVFQLQGSLFFGTADQLYSVVEPYLKVCRYAIFDLKRVQSLDFTAAHRLEQMMDQISEHEGYFIFSDIPESLPTGKNLKGYLDDMGLRKHKQNVKSFRSLEDALEWTEDQILKAELPEMAVEERPLDLAEMALFSEVPPAAIKPLDQIVRLHSFKPNQPIFSQGDKGDELFLIRRGLVRIALPLKNGKRHHLATFGPGDFFGDLSFLDGAIRSADALADGAVELFSLSREKFNQLTELHPELKGAFFLSLSRTMAIRLRHTDAELRVIEEG